MNIYISGVGGQGVGMLSEVLVRAIDYCGYDFKAVDTHGLAQRGGTVVSQIRFGEKVHTALISEGEADICIALELHEAMRSLEKYARDGSALVYYDALWEPLGVRLGNDEKIKEKSIVAHCRKKNVKLIKAFDKDLEDTRMQNIVVLAFLVSRNLIEGLSADHIEKAMSDLMADKLLDANLLVLQRNLSSS